MASRAYICQGCGLDFPNEYSLQIHGPICENAIRRGVGCPRGGAPPGMMGGDRMPPFARGGPRPFMSERAPPSDTRDPFGPSMRERPGFGFATGPRNPFGLPPGLRARPPFPGPFDMPRGMMDDGGPPRGGPPRGDPFARRPPHPLDPRFRGEERFDDMRESFERPPRSHPTGFDAFGAPVRLPLREMGRDGPYTMGPGMGME
ncbi:hypothetical protein LTS18_008947, partial [Coniosporium uncinatum]